MAELYTAYPSNRRQDARVLRSGDHAELVDRRAWDLSKTMLSDGLIEPVQLPLIGATDNDVETLVRHGLWAAEGDGWRIVDFLSFNEPRERIEEMREQAKERKRRHRERQKMPGDADGTRDGTRDEGVTDDSANEKDERERVSESESEESGTRDGTRESRVLSLALEHFVNVPSDEVARYVRIAEERGFTEDEILAGLYRCEYPKHLLTYVRHSLDVPDSNVSDFSFGPRPYCPTCDNVRYLPSEPGDDTRTSRPCPDCSGRAEQVRS